MQSLTVGLLLADPELGLQVRSALQGLPVQVVMDTPAGGPPEVVRWAEQVRRSDPAVLFLDFSQLRQCIPDLLWSIRAVAPLSAIIAVHAAPEPEAILTALRAGASDCLYLPIEKPVLRQALERVAAQRAAVPASQRPRARAIGFFSPTGGCGATTVACHLAAELRRSDNSEVLLADFDLTAGMAAFWMRAGNSYSILDALRSLERLDASLWRGLVSTVQPRLDLISAPSELLIAPGAEAERLLPVLRFARSRYDWLIVDLGHGLSNSTLDLLGELESLFLVTTPEIPALYQARRVLQKLLDLGLPREGVRLVLNRVHKKQQLGPGDLEKILGIAIDAVLPDDIGEVEEAHGAGRLISPRSDLGKRVAQLAARITSAQPQERGALSLSGLGLSAISDLSADTLPALAPGRSR